MYLKSKPMFKKHDEKSLTDTILLNMYAMTNPLENKFHFITGIDSIGLTPEIPLVLNSAGTEYNKFLVQTIESSNKIYEKLQETKNFKKYLSSSKEIWELFENLDFMGVTRENFMDETIPFQLNQTVKNFKNLGNLPSSLFPFEENRDWEDVVINPQRYRKYYSR